MKTWGVKSKFFGFIGLITLLFFIGTGCSKERETTVPNYEPSKLLSVVEITANAFEPGMTIKEIGVAGDANSGSGLSPQAAEITSGITYGVSGCTATDLGGSFRTCCSNLAITNGTGGDISSVVLLGDAGVSGSPTADRTGNSGTGYDGSGTGWGNIAGSNGGWNLWLLRAATGNVISDTQTSDNRTICLTSPSGYSTSRWKLYSGAILGKLQDWKTASAVSGWAMLGSANPDNTNFPELGSGNYINTDSGGNFGFPYLGGATTFTYTVGATNYIRQTIINSPNKNITHKIRQPGYTSRVAVGNYNGTLPKAENPTPAPTYTCAGCTSNVTCGDGYLAAGLVLPTLGYEDIYALDIALFIGPDAYKVQQIDTGTCPPGNLTAMGVSLPTNFLLPTQAAYPLTTLGFNNVNPNIVENEWWTTTPASTANGTIVGLAIALPNSGAQTIFNAKGPGGYISYSKLVSGLVGKGFGFRRDLPTSASNMNAQAFSFSVANTNTVTATLSNYPAALTNDVAGKVRTVVFFAGADFTANPDSMRLSAAGIISGNTSNASLAVSYARGNAIATDVSIQPAVLVGDFDKDVNPWNGDGRSLIADRTVQAVAPNPTMNAFFNIPSLNWTGGSGINEESRRVNYANPEKGTSPWVDAGLAVIAAVPNIVQEETASGNTCQEFSITNTSCCDDQATSPAGACRYDATLPVAMWEIVTKGRVDGTTGPVTSWTLPDLPAAVDLPSFTPGNYPGGYPKVNLLNAAWCPGSPTCTANLSTNEYNAEFDANPTAETIIDTASVLAMNAFSPGAARIINPENLYTCTAPATNDTFVLNGFLDAGNWDLVTCNEVFVQTWETRLDSSGTGGSTKETVKACGTCPTGTACNATYNRCEGAIALTPGGGCSAASGTCAPARAAPSLPGPCFGPITVTCTSITGQNEWYRHIRVQPRNSGTACGGKSTEWYVRCDP
ncbi:MAG TPA: hypothetical protein VII00_04300 [bacterium]